MTTAGRSPYAGLSSRERERLERFATAFEAVPADEYGLLNAVPIPDGSPDATEEAVVGRLGSSRRVAVEAAIRAFQRQAEVNLASRSLVGYRLALTPTTVPNRADDQIRVLASLRRAVLAVALWDELSEDERWQLIGGWGRVAERAGLA